MRIAGAQILHLCARVVVSTASIEGSTNVCAFVSFPFFGAGRDVVISHSWPDQQGQHRINERRLSAAISSNQQRGVAIGLDAIDLSTIAFILAVERTPVVHLQSVQAVTGFGCNRWFEKLGHGEFSLFGSQCSVARLHFPFAIQALRADISIAGADKPRIVSIMNSKA